jgi:hypothetical protein
MSFSCMKNYRLKMVYIYCGSWLCTVQNVQCTYNLPELTLLNRTRKTTHTFWRSHFFSNPYRKTKSKCTDCPRYVPVLRTSQWYGGLLRRECKKILGTVNINFRQCLTGINISAYSIMYTLLCARIKYSFAVPALVSRGIHSTVRSNALLYERRREDCQCLRIST